MPTSSVGWNGEMTQILVDNKLIKPTQIAIEDLLMGGSKGLKDPPQGVQKEKRCESHVDLESRSDNKSVASSKQNVSSHRVHSSMDFRETLKAKQNWEGDLVSKLNNWVVVTPIKPIILVGSVSCITRSKPKGLILRYLLLRMTNRDGGELVCN